MSPALDQFLTLDLAPLLAGLLASVTCALLGSFLVLRRMSLMGDAISHSVLPGIIVAFMLARTRDPLTMLAGAAAAGLLTVVLVELVRRFGRVESGAAMGAVFSVLFAAGVLLLERADLGNVDLDASCVLYGQPETLFWIRPAGAGPIDAAALAALPRQLMIQAVGLVCAFAFVALFYKELRIASFDPQHATSQGFNAGLMHHALMVVVAIATVTSFEAVGSILVIAMLIAPAAAARLLTDRLGSYLWTSVGLAALAALLGHWSSSAVPRAFGAPAVSQAGAITVVSGLLIAIAAVASPTHGTLAKLMSRRRLRARIEDEDLLAALFRLEEAGDRTPSRGALIAGIGEPLDRSAARLARRAMIERQDGSLTLTNQGRRRARRLVRSHRLWETYLVDTAGLSPDHVHDTAERLEHLGIEPAGRAETDPHGKPIPPDLREGAD